MLTILQYVVKQRTSLGFLLATRAEADTSCNNVMKLNISQENFSNLILKY